MDQEKIPVTVGGRIMKVNSTHENLQGSRASKPVNKNIIQQVKRNNGGVKCSVNNNKQKKEHKVVLLGDRHVRDLAAKLNDLLKPNFEVIGYTKPNSKVRSLINPIPEYVSK